MQNSNYQTAHGKSRRIYLHVAFLFMAFLLLIYAVSPVLAIEMKSEAGQKLIETIEAGIPFEGNSRTLDATEVWPGYLLLRLKGSPGTIDGQLEWTSLNHVNYIEGSILETGDIVEVDFTSTKPLVKGKAASGVDYRLIASIKDGQLVLSGRWTMGKYRGPVNMTANPDMAGWQSEFLEGKSIDEMLTGGTSVKQEQPNKPEMIYHDDVVDWDIKGFKYPDGRYMVKLSCNYARGSLHKGMSAGDIFFVITDAPDSPALAFRHRGHDWKDKISGVTQLEVYVSRDAQFTIPVSVSSETGYAISTKPTGRLVRAMIDEIYNDDIEIKAAASSKDFFAYISMRGIDVAWEASKIIMKGQTPPPLHELMESMD